MEAVTDPVEPVATEHPGHRALVDHVLLLSYPCSDLIAITFDYSTFFPSTFGPTTRYPGGVADRLDTRRLEAWRALLGAHRRVLDRLEDELRAGHDLTIAEYEVLMHLGQAEAGRCRMGELARHLLVTPGGVTRIADRLEADGLLRREPSPTDRRSIELVLTGEGRRRLRAAARDHLRGVAEHFGAHVSDREADSLARILGRLAAAATA